MGKALIFGNSHVAAFKLAHARTGATLPYECAFYCALALDPGFTEVQGLRLVPAAHRPVERDELVYFCPDGVRAEVEHYMTTGSPLSDVGRQFRMTGGSEVVDLSEVDAIFYVGGTSPYDFRRLGEFIFPVSEALRRELLARMLRDHFLLRAQITAIRAAAPNIRHYFVGAPLRKWPPVALPPGLKAILEHNRATISRLARDYLFDDVFMPGPSVLAEDLVSTRPEFFARGNQEAQAMLGVAPTREDILHVNADYAEIVFAEFITPRSTAACGHDDPLLREAPCSTTA